MIGILTHSTSPGDQVNLLRKALSAILSPLFPSMETAGIRAPRKGQDTRPLLSVVFFCPSKSSAALFRLLSIMVGCIEQPLKRLAGSFAGSSNLMHPTAKQLELVGGGYSLFKGVRTMSQNNSAQNSEQTTQNSTSADIVPAKSKSCASVELLGRLQQDIDSTTAALSATQLPAKQADFFAEEIQRAQIIHNTLRINAKDDDSLFIGTIINRVFEILREIRTEAKVIKAETPEQLLSKLQQELDSTISSLSNSHITQFGYALNRIQATIDHFNSRLIGDCTQQVADILGLQLDEIREAAQKHRA